MPANPYRSVKPFEKTSLKDSIRAIDAVLISDATGDLKPLTIAFDWSTTPQGSKRWADIFDGHTYLTPDDRAFLEFLRHDFDERIKEASPEPESTKIVPDCDLGNTWRVNLNANLLKVAIGYGIGSTSGDKLVRIGVALNDGRGYVLTDKGRRYLWALYGSK